MLVVGANFKRQGRNGFFEDLVLRLSRVVLEWRGIIVTLLGLTLAILLVDLLLSVFGAVRFERVQPTERE